MSKSIGSNTEEDLEITRTKFPVVGFGTSAGGLAAFKEFIQAISKQLNMAYVLVQNLDPTGKKILPELLQTNSSFPGLKIMDEVVIEPNKIYIIPSSNRLVKHIYEHVGEKQKPTPGSGCFSRMRSLKDMVVPLSWKARRRMARSLHSFCLPNV